MAIIEIREVSKEYQLGKTVVRALKKVDLKIEAGEMLCIMGPSGSGKTTFVFSTHDPRVMKHATRIVHLSDGVIRHDEDSKASVTNILEKRLSK
jgi:ABC-type lipoprotein export system ATPase subunit